MPSDPLPIKKTLLVKLLGTWLSYFKVDISGSTFQVTVATNTPKVSKSVIPECIKNLNLTFSVHKL